MCVMGAASVPLNVEGDVGGVEPDIVVVLVVVVAAVVVIFR